MTSHTHTPEVVVNTREVGIMAMLIFALDFDLIDVEGEDRHEVLALVHRIKSDLRGLEPGQVFRTVFRDQPSH